MSDQYVVTDWRAYLESLGPGKPFSSEQLEAMRDKAPHVAVVLDVEPGGLMSRFLLADANCLDTARALWEANLRPRAWLMRGSSGAPWFCDAASLPTRGKVKKRA